MDFRIPARWRAWSLAFVCIFIGVAQAASPQRWTLVDIGAASGDGNARAMNQRGDVVGNSAAIVNGLFTSHGYLWQNGIATSLGGGSSAEVVSDRGTVYFNSAGVSHSWKDGVATRLPFAAFMHGVSRNETLVGGRWWGGSIGSGRYEAFMYRDGLMLDLPALGGSHSDALGINDHGVVVGYGIKPFSSDRQALYWENQQPRLLQGIGGRNSGAGRVNNHGLVLGGADDASGIPHLLTWDLRQGGAITLVMPRHSGHDLNNRGAIVGSTWPDGKPFLLEDGVMTMLLELPALRDAGWVTFAPTAINDRGWIAGIGWKPGISSFGRPLLLVPR